MKEKHICDHCGEYLLCYVITPQDYKDITGYRCRECLKELEIDWDIAP